MTFFERLATVLRRFPFLLIVPYQILKIFQPKFTVGVVGVVLNDKQEVLLVEHVFHPTVPWGLPGGWVDKDEDPSLAVTREIQEELGIEATVTDLLLLNKSHPHHLDIAFLCRTDNPTVRDLSYELTDYGWYAFDTLPPLHKFQYSALQIVKTRLQDEDLIL